MRIKINGKKYKAEEGETVLDVCRREGIRIPTLCAHGKLKREAACRLCLVEVENANSRSEKNRNAHARSLQTSCTTKVVDGMEVTTESEQIKKAREINMELLWSDHAGKCATCKKNRRCELQKLAEEYKIENFHFVPRRGEMTGSEELDLLRDNWSRVVVDEENPVIARTTEYCVECKRCVNICPIKSYGFNYRAGDTVVGTPYEKTLDCLFCGACVKHCPTAALADQNNFKEIKNKLEDIKVLAVAIVDPAVYESVGIEFPTSPPAPLPAYRTGRLIKERGAERLNGILREMGFEKVFSLDLGFEKYIEKLSEELESMPGGQVLMNSHCPAFSRFIEKFYPELKKNIARVEIPDEIAAEFIKNDYARREKIKPQKIYVVSITSCTAKKARAYKNLDALGTVRELGRIARDNKLDLGSIRESKFDLLSGEKIKNGKKIIETGGTVQELKTAKKIKSIAVNNMDDIRKVLDSIKMKKEHYDYAEGMICPGGCVHGGGQAIEIQ